MAFKFITINYKEEPTKELKENMKILREETKNEKLLNSVQGYIKDNPKDDKLQVLKNIAYNITKEIPITGTQYNILKAKGIIGDKTELQIKENKTMKKSDLKELIKEQLGAITGYQVMGNPFGSRTDERYKIEVMEDVRVDDEDKITANFDAFTDALAKLSKKYGVALNCTGGVELGEIKRITYSKDWTSGDLEYDAVWV